MPAKIFSAAIFGLECQPIEVEVDMTVGLHCFHIVGLPDTAVNEAKERVSAAIKNIGLTPPQHSRRRVVVNLAPADIKKGGSSYDLPIALAYLMASEQINLDNNEIKNKLFAGELSLDGKLRPINGALSLALLSEERGFKTLILPKANAPEAALVKNLEVIGIETLSDMVDFLEKRKQIAAEPMPDYEKILLNNTYPFDMGFVKGQEHVKRALEIAAAGGHNILMKGPPGTGKTLLARTLPSILPPLTFQEAMEITKIHSVAGLLKAKEFLIKERPFRSPHHTSSAIALVGGGTNPKPGEITLSHRGILFLDEFPEFPRSVLESLRQPLEDGHITISRAAGSLNFPAKFMLIAAMNPCPCGKAGDKEASCLCTPPQIIKYQKKISEPLLDRIDIHIEVPKIKYEELVSDGGEGERSSAIRERISQARQIQYNRFVDEKILINSEMSNQQIKKYCELDSACHDILKNAMMRYKLSPRSFHRSIKLARTIADLTGAEKIQSQHIAEALQYRPKSEN